MVLGEPPPELASLIERRRALGQDLYDEVWEGIRHLGPAPRPVHGYIDRALAVLLAPAAAAARLFGTGPFNLGTPDNYRVPDGGYHRSLPDQVFLPTAAVVVEVVSPDDETYEKFAFYAAHGVDELLIADPASRQVRLWRRTGDDSYAESDASALLNVTAADLTARLDWFPP